MKTFAISNFYSGDRYFQVRVPGNNLCAVPSLSWCAARRLVQTHGRADQRPERGLVDRFALADVDCTPGVTIEARVEKAGMVLQ